jgi:hypothetical protein
MAAGFDFSGHYYFSDQPLCGGCAESLVDYI